MYDKVKNQLEDNFDSIAPDLFINIKNARADKILSEDELFNLVDEDIHADKVPVFPLRRTGTLVAAAIFICIISIFFYSTLMPTGTITIMADTTIRLSINHSNKIIHAEVDHPGSIDMGELEGKDLGEALDIVLDTISTTDNENKNVSIEVKSNQKMKSAKKILAEKAEKYTRNKKMVIDGNYQSVHNSANSKNADSGHNDSTETEADNQKDVSMTEKKSSDDSTSGQGAEDVEDTSDVIASSTASDQPETEPASNEETDSSSNDKENQSDDENQTDVSDQSESDNMAEAEEQEETEDQSDMNESQEKMDQSEDTVTDEEVTTETDSSQENQKSED